MNMGSTKNLQVFVLVIIVLTVENTNANYCLHQLINIGGLDINFNSTEAFDYIYHKIDTSAREILGPYRDILRRYIDDLLNAALLSCPDNVIQGPLEWCKANISRIEVSINKLQIEPTCLKKMNDCGFETSDIPRKSLIHSYYKLTQRRSMHEVSRAYYEYIFNKFSTFIKHSKAVGPIEYCATNTDCIEQITGNSGIKIQFSGKQAFQFVYENCFSYTTKGADKVILRQYVKYLYDETISVYSEGIFLHPMKWCLANISTFKKVINKDHKNRMCKELLQSRKFLYADNGLQIFTNAYFNIRSSMKLNDITRGYFTHMLQEILQRISDDSGIQGPQEYCNSLNSSLNYISANDLRDHLLSTQISGDKQLPDESTNEYLEEGEHLNLSLELRPASTSFKSTQSTTNSLDHNRTENYGNAQTSSEFTHNSDLINPAPSDFYRINYNQTDNLNSRAQEKYWNLAPLSEYTSDTDNNNFATTTSNSLDQNQSDAQMPDNLPNIGNRPIQSPSSTPAQHQYDFNNYNNYYHRFNQ